MDSEVTSAVRRSTRTRKRVSPPPIEVSEPPPKAKKPKSQKPSSSSKSSKLAVKSAPKDAKTSQATKRAKTDGDEKPAPSNPDSKKRAKSTVSTSTIVFTADSTIPLIPLVNGCKENVTIPQLGFGTYRLKGDLVVAPLRAALELGYPLLDTAWIYDNEREIGTLLSSIDTKSKASTSSTPTSTSPVFVTTKLWRSNQGSEPIVRKHLNTSLKRLGLDCVDLFLLHWPGPGRHLFKRYQIPADWTPATRAETWGAMVSLMNQGKARAVGVSNFTIRHLEELKKTSSVRPAVNQVELHPFLVQKKLLDYCRKEGIVVMAYCSLGEGDRELLQHPVVKDVAKKVGRTTAQVLLRWGVQHGAVVIPGSTSEEHIRENMDIWDFKIEGEDMGRLDALNKDKRYGWKGQDPETVP
ncbi:hypothetical protein HK102_008240 [Quaeritorhiza haematococci]|nr:hypothetical protein HK102_008240 [Quaeritorhiza haematococci]